ncbi:MAG: hypothetical protein U0J41_00620, partial [Slackia isoflavoniconvertens]|nr:hypothetical protein [Slackia isoflavoniconvertens]
GKVDSDDFSHKKWALACANAQNQTHYLSYKPRLEARPANPPSNARKPPLRAAFVIRGSVRA